MNKQTVSPFILALKAYNLTVKIHHHSAYQIVLSNDIAYQKFGNIDVLQTIEEPKPSIQTHQVLVKVKAVSINPMIGKFAMAK